MLRKFFSLQDGLFYLSFPRFLSAGHKGCTHQNTVSHHLAFYTNFLTSLQRPLLQTRRHLHILSSTSREFEQTYTSPVTLRKDNLHSKSWAVLCDKVGLRDGISQKVHLLSLLPAYSSPQYLWCGLHIHCYIVQIALELDVVVATALVKMYSKCGSLDDARGVFDAVSDRDVVLWTTIITAYAKRGLVKSAVELFDSMLDTKVTPDAISFVNLLNACRSCSTSDIDTLCRRIVNAGLDMDFGVGMALLNVHVKQGNLTEAREVFYKLPKHNRITWNSMISLYAHLGCTHEALQLYNDMLQEGLVPDAITFVAVLQALCQEVTLPHVRQMHVCILAAQLASNMILLTTLMNTYGKCKSEEGALGLWECIETKNVVVWSAFIAVLTQFRLGQRGLDCLSRMLEEGVLPNEVTYTSSLHASTLENMLTRGKQLHACLQGSEAFLNVSLVTALLILYSKCSSLEEVRRLFDIAKNRDVVLWTAAVSAHTFHNDGCIAAQLFYQMQEEGILPNVVTYTGVLEAYSTLPSLAVLKQVNARIRSKDLTSNIELGTALVNTYGKCGCLMYARSVFDAMVFKDKQSWTAIVSACAHNGEEKEALKALELMVQQGVLPDIVTFLSIMASCSHSGLLNLGIDLFFRMQNDFGLEPSASHYDCVIDLLGRAGQLNVAEQLLNSMPAIPSEVSWTTVLAACRNKIDIYRGKRIAQHMFDAGTQDASPYVTLSNVLDAAMQQEHASV